MLDDRSIEKIADAVIARIEELRTVDEIAKAVLGKIQHGVSARDALSAAPQRPTCSRQGLG